MRTTFAIAMFMAGLCMSDRWPDIATETLAKARGALVGSPEVLSPPLQPENDGV